MPDIALVAELRTDRGTRPSKRLRSVGRVPAIVYGHGEDPVAVSVDARELRSALAAQSGGSVLFNLRVGSQDHLVIARDVQRHPIRHHPSHVDFQVVRRDEVVPADVAIQLVGEALAVTRAGGTVDQALLSIHLRAKPADIPAAIVVDISELEIGTTVRLADLDLPEGVIIDLDPETPIVVAQATRAGTDLGEEGTESEEDTETSAES